MFERNTDFRLKKKIKSAAQWKWIPAKRQLPRALRGGAFQVRCLRMESPTCPTPQGWPLAHPPALWAHEPMGPQIGQQQIQIQEGHVPKFLGRVFVEAKTTSGIVLDSWSFEKSQTRIFKFRETFPGSYPTIWSIWYGKLNGTAARLD